MNRMHTQDLRAIVAAIQCLDPHAQGQVPSEHAVVWADSLLAELERTAKPEVNEPDIAQIRADVYRFGARDERERIIALLYGGPDLRVQIDMGGGWVTVASEEVIRAALEPKR